ncbi:MAG TPA: DUF2330 domain-containing protein [bacterium (Candidatus Stahlbacteria)]|nr:DUF2330 domain-containing protein [Candidatus Stahlbacteria bacterium]
MAYFIWITLLFQDRGVWSYLRPDVNVYEPGQKAVIAYNRGTEILILSNDLYAEEETKVLEILPLPSVPEIDSSDITVFYRVQEKIQEHIFKFAEEMNLAFDKRRGKGIKELFHKRIGPHGLTVVRITSKKDFKEWLYRFLEKEGVSEIPETARIESLVTLYLDDEINYFVFDVVEVGRDPSSVFPLKFRFRTRSLYFPLRISTLAQGNTKIQLFLITRHIPDLFRNYPLEPGKMMIGIPLEAKLHSQDLFRIEPDFARLLGGSAYLTALHYDGPVSGLSKDLMIKRFYKLIRN